MKQVRDNDQPALMEMVETGNGKYICIWNMAGWWYKLTEYDDATQTHAAIGKTYGSLEEAKAAAEEFATGGMVSDSAIKDSEASDIRKAKNKLIKKAQKSGIYEDFGQNEVRDLQDKYGYTAAVEAFDDWCMNYDGHINDSQEAKAAAEEFAGGEMVSDSEKVKDGIWNQADTENFKKELNAALRAVGNGVRQGEGGLQFTFDALDSALESMGYEYEREFRPWGEDAGFEYSNGLQTLKFFLRMANRNERQTFYYMPIHGGLDIHNSKPSISDSKKIKDENTMDVLDGHLALSFKEGTEEETYKAIQGHANESGELDGVQYETYEIGEQDGVAIIDMCAATDDPNNFVKALLKKWGVIDNIADMKFQASEEMKEAQKEEDGDQVSDSSKIEDEIKLTKNASGDGKNDIGVGFKYKGERKLNKSEVAELDKVVKDWSKEKFGEVIFDSRKVKDSVGNWSLWVYDVWGNEDDGYEVNRRDEVDNNLDINSNTSDEELLDILKKYGIFDKSVDVDEIRTERNKDLIIVYEVYNDLPVCEFLDDNAWDYTDNQKVKDSYIEKNYYAGMVESFDNALKQYVSPDLKVNDSGKGVVSVNISKLSDEEIEDVLSWADKYGFNNSGSEGSTIKFRNRNLISDSRRIKDSKGLNFEIIYEMNDDQFADFIDEIITIFEWYYGEDMPDVVDDLFTPKMITKDDMVTVLDALGYEELDKILSAYGANNSYDSIIDELFL